MDPFASIDDEVGRPSDSQEERLLHSTFINDSPDNLSLPPTDAPVVIHSLHDSSSPAAGRAAGLELPQVGAKGKTPAVAGDAPHGGCENPGPSKRCKVKSCASRGRLRGVQIRSSASPGGTPSDEDEELGFGEGGVPSSRPGQEDGMRSEHPQSNPNAQTSTTKPDFAAKVVPVSRKLPASIGNPPPAEGNVGFYSSTAGGRNSPPSIPREAASVADKPDLTGSLLDVIKMLSEKPSRRFAEIDLLEILEMKGARLLPPQWWRPEGYDH